MQRKLTGTPAPSRRKSRGEEEDDYDSPWKETIECYFADFLALLFPELHALIDWNQEHVFLDQEFRAVVRNARQGKRTVDKLVRVHLKAGGSLCVYLHIEIQASREHNFQKRMYTYHYRIFDKLDGLVGSFAVLADDEPGWNPGQYSYEIAGSRLKFEFPVVKLKAFEQRQDELLACDNPVAWIIVAHLTTRATRRHNDQRYQAKRHLIRMLLGKGWPEQKILHLLSVLDWILTLPEELEQSLWQEITADTEEPAMNYVTSIERIGIQKGLQLGLEQGLEQGLERGREQGREQGLEQGIRTGEVTLLLTVLEHRFGSELTEALRNRLFAADEAHLKEWMIRCLDAKTLGDVFAPPLH